ncbi:MAG TPA: tripartite tricarboxylate transporter substrate binding protein [Methylibium sp.]|uniref:Bug family tripartite tricarboxylate transporter substrate binding protein n=1 Tax=Methylibium sp. TaxID=2067992 RepID=UPI002DBB5587|nr:tripartite tricarboxylate transporter substrate binding protein [Methylibium sp.]HEU4460535.1 tripartite tricarboxylate transporter substrate binding protein [Methylibium sp.]
MTTLPRRHLAASMLAAALFVALPAIAQAQYPERGLKLVVGFPPGSGPDVVARTLGQKLGEALKQPLVVDNRAGAGGQIGAQAVAKSAPDGYTLLLGEVGSISIAPAVYSKLPYDPAKELVAVAQVARADFVLVVPQASPAQSVADLVKSAKARNDRLNMATFGAGTPGHFGAELLAGLAGFAVEPVHYRATGDAVTALIAGDVQGALLSTALAAPQVKAGKMRALATTAPARSALLPEVPTFAEAGLPKMDVSAWFAVLAPAATPPAVLDLLGREVVAAVQSAEVGPKLQEAGFAVDPRGRAATEALLKSEAARWAQLVKAVGFRGD